jgi:hypothetical protein
MSEYHILEQADDKEQITVIFHFTVPQAATNEANILYPNIVKMSEELTSLLPLHQTNFPQEYQDMQDGKVIERRVVVQLSSSTLTPLEKRNEIEQGNYIWIGYNAYKTQLFDDLQITWEWYGYDGDVA